MTLVNAIALNSKKPSILVSADTRSMQGAEGDDQTNKIFPIAKNVLGAGAGVLNTIYDSIEGVQKDEIVTTKSAVQSIFDSTQSEISGRLRTSQGPKTSLEMSILIGGIDGVDPRLYSIYTSSTGQSDYFRIVEPFISAGSGSGVARPIIKQWVQFYEGKDYQTPLTATTLPRKSAIECLTAAHLAASEYTPTVGPEFKISELIFNGKHYVVKDVKTLPIRKIRKERDQMGELFALMRNNPKAISNLLNQ
jgi:20S proteasome alpha/beta subunit